MGHLARQCLPARELGQVDEPRALAFELVRHVVERSNGASDLVVADSGDANGEIARRQRGETGRQIVDRAADARRKEDQQNEGNQPCAEGQDQEREN